MALVGKLALVTGGGSGIGRATCKVFAKEGAQVIVADLMKKNVNETLKLISTSNNSQHLGVDINVAKVESVKTVLKEVLDSYKRPPSIIVNCAGITRDNFLLKLSEQDFDEVINVNLKGTFLVTQTFANAIAEQQIKNGSIVNIASIVGKYGNIGQANYCASKAGVELLTKTASKELGKFGIRVNCVLPGMIVTPMLQAVPDKVKSKFMGMISLGRFGEPEEIAEVIAFLASEKSSFINGASIEVTGGF